MDKLFLYKLLTGVLLAVVMSANVAAEEANQDNTDHWRVQGQYTFKDYSNSPQKEEGTSLALDLERRLGRNLFQLGYEAASTETFQPPLPRDLEIDKFHLRYQRQWNDKFSFSASGIVIEDNIAPTDNGKVYGVGITYSPNRQTTLGLARYLSHYDQFDVHQSDLSVGRKFKLAQCNVRLGLIAKYIEIDDRLSNGYTRNAEDDYLTVGANLMLAHEGWFGGGGVFFGERAFAIMAKGTKVQHHAMEFDRTYNIVVGRRFGKAELALHYSYMRATELPINNSGVEVNSTSLKIGYKF